MKKVVKNQSLAKLFLFSSLFVASSAFALPEAVERALETWNVPEEDIAIWIAPAGSRKAVFSHNETEAFHPASVIKTVTTLAGLEILGPAYTWNTSVYADYPIDAQGQISNVVVKGGGDPHFVIERLWLMCEKLKARGVKKIIGDIGIDRTAFLLAKNETTVVSDDKWRAYSVKPDPALLNQKTMSIDIVPEASGVARVTTLPLLHGVSVDKTVKLSGGPCNNWRGKLRVAVTDQAVTFQGSYPARCGKQTLQLSAWSANEYGTKVLSHILHEVGIEWNGVAKDGSLQANATLILKEESEPLSQMVTLINKYSNNPMARQLFLTLSFADGDGEAKPATLARARGVLNRWVGSTGAKVKEIYIDNGSGLSEKTKISAENLGKILSYGARSAYAAEFISSLPLAGIDGTMKKRAIAGGVAHVKTGRTRNVRSIAGFIKDKKGRDWTIVVMINTDQVADTENAIDDLLRWVARGASGF